MTFPRTLPIVTIEVPDSGTFYELPVYASRMSFGLESFYQREAISAKKDYAPRDLRFNMSLSFDQTQNHDTLRDLFNELVEVQDGAIRMHFSTQDEISDNYIEVINEGFAAAMNYENQIRKHNYNLNFTAVFAGGLFAFVIDNDGFFVLDNSGNRIKVQLTL